MNDLKKYHLHFNFLLFVIMLIELKESWNVSDVSNVLKVWNHIRAK